MPGPVLGTGDVMVSEQRKMKALPIKCSEEDRY